MRKLGFRILLTCLLVFSQLGALVHEIGHQGASVTLQGRSAGDPAADPLCGLCLAFAQLAAFAQPAAPAVPQLAVRALQYTAVLPGGRDVSVARGRNRDPPAAA